MDQFDEHQLKYDPNRGNLVAPDGRDAYSDGKGGYTDSMGHQVVQGQNPYAPGSAGNPAPPYAAPPGYARDVSPQERKKALRKLRNIAIAAASLAALIWGANEYQEYARVQEGRRILAEAVRKRLGDAEYNALQAGLAKWDQDRDELPTLINLNKIPGVDASFGLDYKGRRVLGDEETAKAVGNDLARNPADPVAQAKAVQCLTEPWCARGLIDPKRSAGLPGIGKALGALYGRAFADFESQAPAQAPDKAPEICRFSALTRRRLAAIGFPGFNLGDAARKAILCNETTPYKTVDAQSVKNALEAYLKAGGAGR